MRNRAEPRGLLLAKFNRPVISQGVVRRGALHARLHAGLGKPLTLVSAGAGFGKTTLLASWLAECDCTAAWLFLDRDDRDLRLFLRYVVAAIRTVAPGACARTLELVQAQQLPPTNILAAAFSNDLEALAGDAAPGSSRRRVLVLDDYHLAAGQAVNDFLDAFLEHPPSALHLVISTRSDPPLHLNRLRGNDQITEIRARDLRFSAREIVDFMRQALGEPLEDRLVAGLESKTEGWAAGLRLVAFSASSSRGSIDNIVGHVDDNRAIADYLLDEVLSGLPAEDHRFLLETAILEQLTGSLCDAVTGEGGPVSGSQARLEWLHQANLFTFALDAQGRWYTYHHLFRALLLAELAQRADTAQIAALHARASAWYAANGFVDEAISHALQANDEPAAIALVQAYRHDAMNREDWTRLERWLGLFPRATIDSRAELLLLEAWLFVNRVQVAELAPCLRRVEEIMQRNPPPEPLAGAMQSEVDTLHGFVSFFALDPERGLARSRRALATAPLEYSNVRGHAWLWQAGALLLMGERTAALESLHEGRREDRHHLNTFQTRLLLALANVYWWTADLQNLTLTGKHLLTVAEDLHLPESAVRGHYHQGLAHYQQNDLASAERDFAAVLQQPYLAYPIVFVQSGIGLASVYLAQGRADQTRDVIETLSAYVLRRNNADFLADVEAFSAHCAVAQGRAFEASYWLAAQGDGFRRGPLIKLRDPGVTQAEVLLADGRPESLRRAADLLPRLLDFVTSVHSTRYQIEVLALQALLYDAQGERAAALTVLRQAVTLAQPGGVIRVFADLGPKMAVLLQQLRPRDVAPDYLERLLAAFPPSRDSRSAHDHSGLIEPLTDRELEVLALLRERLSNKEIAGALCISPLTVKRHTTNIFQKLAVENRREAIVKANTLGIITPVAPRVPS